jgi:hypothetical protein
MRYLSLLLTLAALLLLAACQPNVDPQETQEPETGPTATAPLPVEGEPTEESAPQASPTPEGYPGLPQPTQSLDGYPAQPEAQAPPTGYPDDMVVWMMRPLGQQCVDPENYEYPELSAAVTALEEAGVEVMASETIEMAVCEACDCPTSEHFRVQISAQDMEQVESMGWTRVEGE